MKTNFLTNFLSKIRKNGKIDQNITFRRVIMVAEASVTYPRRTRAIKKSFRANLV